MVYHLFGSKPSPEQMLTRFTDAYVRHWGEMSSVYLTYCGAGKEYGHSAILSKSMNQFVQNFRQPLLDGTPPNGHIKLPGLDRKRANVTTVLTSVNM